MNKEFIYKEDLEKWLIDWAKEGLFYDKTGQTMHIRDMVKALPLVIDTNLPTHTLPVMDKEGLVEVIESVVGRQKALIDVATLAKVILDKYGAGAEREHREGTPEVANAVGELPLTDRPASPSLPECSVLKHVPTTASDRTTLPEPDEVVAVLRLILPMAKGYAYKNKVGNNMKFIEKAENVLARITEVKGNE